MVRSRLEETVGWPAFLLFFVAGGLLAFGLIGAASIGLLILPFGVFLFGLLIAYAPDRRDRWGVLAGIGVIGVLIGFLNLGHRPCGERGVAVETGQGTSSCGGFDGRPFLAIGLALVAAALVLYRRQPVVQENSGTP